MKNKNKYNLTKLRFVKRNPNNDYVLAYVYDVYKGKEKIATIQGGAMSDILVWLESEENDSTK